MILVFWMLSFKPGFSLSSFTFIKRLFISSSLSAIKVVSSAYLRLLIFLPAILILAYASSSLAFYMMYSIRSNPLNLFFTSTVFVRLRVHAIPGAGGEGEPYLRKSLKTVNTQVGTGPCKGLLYVRGLDPSSALEQSASTEIPWGVGSYRPQMEKTKLLRVNCNWDQCWKGIRLPTF